MLRREGVGIAFLLALLFLFLFLFLKQLSNLHFQDVEVRMEMTDLPLVEVKALAEVFGSCKLNSFLKSSKDLNSSMVVILAIATCFLSFPTSTSWSSLIFLARRQPTAFWLGPRSIILLTYWPVFGLGSSHPRARQPNLGRGLPHPSFSCFI